MKIIWLCFLKGFKIRKKLFLRFKEKFRNTLEIALGLKVDSDSDFDIWICYNQL